MRTISFKQNFQDASIRIKLILIISLSVLIALIMVATAITGYEYQTRRQHTADDLSSIADIISWNSAAALAFNDAQTASQTLHALETQPGKVAAFLYTPEGEIFAKYQTSYNPDNEFVPTKALLLVNGSALDHLKAQNAVDQIIYEIRHLFDNTSTRLIKPGYSEVIQYDQHKQMHLFRPIFVDSELVGILHLVDDQREIRAFFANFYLILGSIVWVTLFANLVISTRLQRIFSEPLLNLMSAMQRVAYEKKFTTQVQKNSHDEFGQLVDVYNDMLKEIHLRGEQLDKHLEGLEMQVAARTSQLTTANGALQIAVSEAVSAKEEAEAANHAKSQFLANMSHEIRTPMNAVLGMTEFLYESSLNSDQRQSIEMVQQSGRLLLAVINDILDFSKIESQKLELENQSFDVQELIQNTFNMLQSQAKDKGLQYRLKVSEVHPVLQGDAVRLSQVVTNLLSNAVKFTTQGEVVLKVRTENLTAKTVRFLCEVHDTGIGVGRQKQALIFDPFSQADNSMTRAFGGTGLGLSIAKQLVRLMGGELGLNSALGEGSTFWFWVDLQKSADVVVPLKALPNCKFNANILVVEDYPANQILVERFLEVFGCQVSLVNNGLEAIEILQQHTFDLVLMDCQMPVMDGYTATQEIRRLETLKKGAGRLPIIALTAHALAGDRAKCLNAGMDDWLTKPFTRQELNSTLQKWLPPFSVIAMPETQKTEHEGGALAATENVAAVDIHFLQQNFNLDDEDDLIFILSLKEVFQQNAERTIAEIGPAIAQCDSEMVRKLAHGLKSISANVGGKQLSAYCKTMEDFSRQGQLQTAEPLLQSMQFEYTRVLMQLDELCAPVAALVI